MKQLFILAIVSSIIYTGNVNADGKSIQQPAGESLFHAGDHERRFPEHWGHPPRIQVRDHVKLPAKFGYGSSSVAKWILDNLRKDGKLINDRQDEIKNKREQYNKTKQELGKKLMVRLKEHGPRLTKEDTKRIVSQFHKEHAETIEEQKELSASIQKWDADNKPAKREPVKLSIVHRKQLDVINEKKQAVAEGRKGVKSRIDTSDQELASLRKQILEETKDRNNQEDIDKLKLELARCIADKKDIISRFRDAQRVKHTELKAAKKELEASIRGKKQTEERRR